MDNRYKKENFDNFSKETLEEIENIFGKEQVLIYGVDLYGGYRESLYIEDEYEYVKLSFGLKVLTDDMEASTVIRDYRFKRPIGRTAIQCVGDLKEQLNKEARFGSGFVVKEGDSYKIKRSGEEIREVAYTLISETFCEKMIIDSTTGRSREPLIVDNFRVIGVRNIKKHLGENEYREVKKVEVWEDYETAVQLQGIRKDMRLGKTIMEVVYEDKYGRITKCTLEVPYIVGTEEAEARITKEGWQNHIKDVLNS